MDGVVICEETLVLTINDDLRIDTDFVETVDSLTFLGVTIQNDLNEKLAHINNYNQENRKRLSTTEGTCRRSD